MGAPQRRDVGTIAVLMGVMATEILLATAGLLSFAALAISTLVLAGFGWRPIR